MYSVGHITIYSLMPPNIGGMGHAECAEDGMHHSIASDAALGMLDGMVFAPGRMVRCLKGVPGHLRDLRGVSLGRILGGPWIEPFGGGSSQRAVSTPPSLRS